MVREKEAPPNSPPYRLSPRLVDLHDECSIRSRLHICTFFPSLYELVTTNWLVQSNVSKLPGVLDIDSNAT